MSSQVASTQPQTNGTNSTASSTTGTGNGTVTAPGEGESSGVAASGSVLNDNSRSLSNNTISSSSKKQKKIRISSEGVINTKLKCVQDLVDGQPVKELRTALLALCKSNLKALQEIRKRTLGVNKLLSDKNYVPSLVRTSPTLYYPEELKQDEATIKAEAEFNELVKNLNSGLAKIIRGQAVRNNNSKI